MSAPITNIVSRLSPVKFDSKQRVDGFSNVKLAQKEGSDEADGTESTDGAVDSTQTPCQAVTCVPFVVEFRRLLHNVKFKTVDVIPGIPNRELLHAVVALYDNCLPDITPEVLYDTVAGKGARTLILIRDTKEVLQYLEKKSKVSDKTAQDAGATNGCGDAGDEAGDEDMKMEDLITGEDKTPRNGTCETKIGGEEEKKKMFADVFSDSESEDAGSDSEEEEEDFSKGVDEFLSAVKERREKRKKALETGDGLASSMGIEHRLVACATWEKSYIRPGEKITQIDLLAVRKRLRKQGIGKYLIQNMKDSSLVGLYDSLVVYADHSAVDFFANFGFSDDIILNSKYSEIADNWTNCQLMCYLPPFTGQTILRESDAVLDMKMMELEIQKWTEKSRESYQAQYGCIMRLRHEIITLKALVSSQQDLIESLSSELRQIQTEKFHIEKDFLHHKIKTLKDGFSGTDSMRCFPDNESDYQDLGDEDIDTESLIQQLEKSATISEVSLSEEEIDEEKDVAHTAAAHINEKVAEDFKYGMLLDPIIGGRCVVTGTLKASLNDTIQNVLETRLQQLGSDVMATNLYFCGTLQHPERIPQILTNGFSDQDMSHGEYGVGLYFSQRPSKAAHFSALGQMLLVEVALGKTESVPKVDRTRTAPPQGYHSIITPGRLSKGSSGDISPTTSENQEFVIFDPLQAKPLYLIEYTLEN